MTSPFSSSSSMYCVQAYTLKSQWISDSGLTIIFHLTFIFTLVFYRTLDSFKVVLHDESLDERLASESGLHNQ